MSEQLIPLPKSSSHIEYTQLGYLENYDAIANQSYAFLVYKELSNSSGKWQVKIKSKNTAGTSIDAESSALKSNIQKAQGQGEDYVVWGFNFSTTETDPRVVENRIYFDKDKQVTHIEIHLVTRKADGSPDEEKVLKVDWPATEAEKAAAAEPEQLIPLPKSSAHIEYTQLGYLEDYDAVVDQNYAFLVYKELSNSSGKWLVKIKSKNTAGTNIDAESSALKSNIQKAAANDEEYLVWGFNFVTTEQDPRIVQTRIFFDKDQKVTHIEQHLVTRKADGSPNEEKVLKVEWPK